MFDVNGHRPSSPAPGPRWHGDDRDWKANIGRPDPAECEPPISPRARAVATAVFYAAADHNTIFRAPWPIQIHSWGRVFDCGPLGCMEWLTVDLAVEAVTAHFTQSIDGRMLPFHVVREATFLRLGRL
ncbi:hypothetical protein [Rhodococcus jostii]|uniref:hypothetical protein n=1 Tax=Rhodococcus jostii TaxID=132919 RepID=UPI0036391324